MGHEWGEETAVGTVDERVRRLSVCKLDVEALLDTLRERMGDDWANIRLEVDPRSFVSDGQKPGVKMCRYKHWMGPPKPHDGYIPPAHYRALLRFRLCVSDLAVNSDSTRSRGQRGCCACRTIGAIEDEQHFLLECPALDPVRQGLWGLGVPTSTSVAEVMQVNDQRGLAKIVFEMFRMRLEHLAS